MNTWKEFLKQIWLIAGLFSAGFLVACVSTSVTPMGRNIFAITTIVDAECGLAEANAIALKQIAAATIKNGFSAFEIQQIQSNQSSTVVGTTPIYVNGNSVNGYNIFGGQLIVESQFHQNVVVKMYRSTDLEASAVIDARNVLGPQWAKLAAEIKTTCF